eukprot:5276196-Pyramimonas_sp.AAC.1
MSVYTDAGEVMDRSRIRTECKMFGMTRFGDEDNAFDVQEERLQRLCSTGRNQILDGIGVKPLILCRVLQPRAALSTDTAAG